MAQPPEYTRQYSFTNWQTSNPDDPLPAQQIEAELNAVKTTIDALRANLSMIQRDDGELANLSVGLEQLSTTLLTGVNPPTRWTVAPTSYSPGDTVVYIDTGSSRSELWRVDTAHTSTTDFDTDSAAYMTQLADFQFSAVDASATPYVAGSNTYVTGSNVQDALDAIEARLMALVIGTHVQAYSAKLDTLAALSSVANLSALAGVTLAADKGLYATGAGALTTFDLKSAGRTFLAAASTAAQRTALGLGNIATTNLIDEDDMASDSAAQAPTQQSVKAYVDAVDPGALKWIATADASGEAALDFTFDASLYDAYCLVLGNLIPGTDGVSAQIRLSNDGGSTFIAGTSYSVALHGHSSGGAMAESDTAASAIYLNDLSAGNLIGNAAGEPGISGVVWITMPHLTKSTMVRASTVYVNTAAGIAVADIGGINKTAEANNAIRFLFSSSATITSGTATLYGLRNA